jgi:AraC family ethanolamine operon transcriptional activator
VQPEIVSRVVRGFDADRLRQSFRPGEIDHRLLEPGLFDAHLLRVSTDKLALGFFRYSLPVALNGTWPEDCLALLFGLEVPEGAVAHGQPFPSGAIVVLDRSTGMDIRLSAYATCAILIVDRASVEAALSGCDSAAGFCGAANGIPLWVREPEARRLKGLLRAVLDEAELAGQSLRTSAFPPALEREVLRSYARALAASRRLHMKGASVHDRRNRLVKKAEEYVIERLDQSIHMETLCREVGASPRALEYAFRAIYGMGAMRYLRIIRLNEARRALSRSDASKPATVTTVAMEWGFWHLGEFAAAYRRLFGEPPSETLRKAALRDGGTAGAYARATDCAALPMKPAPAARNSLFH